MENIEAVVEVFASDRPSLPYGVRLLDLDTNCYWPEFRFFPNREGAMAYAQSITGQYMRLKALPS